MLKELLSAITNSASTTAYVLPSSNGISGVPASATFKNFFNSLLSSFSGGSPVGGFGRQAQGYNSGIPMQSIQAYRNLQSGFPPQHHGRAQALAPGAVVINSLTSGGLQPPMPIVNQGFYPPIQALAGGSGIGMNPLQGFAGGGPIPGGVQGGQVPGGFNTPFGQPGSIPMMPYGYGQQGGFGKLQLLLLPIIGIFTLIKSLFNVRGFMNSMRPIQIDKNNLSLLHTQNSYDEYEREDGSFDEYNPPERVDENSFDITKMQEY